MFNTLIGSIRGIADVQIKNQDGELVEIGAQLTDVIMAIPNKPDEDIDEILIYDCDDRDMAIAIIRRDSIGIQSISELLHL